MDYNTSLPHLIIPEYGRNIQKMIDHAITLADREERNRMAKAIIDVMGQLNPHLRDVADFKHKLWDHLFIISDFKLDVDSPYPIPSRETFTSKPDRVAYPSHNIKYKHYGKTVENLIEKAITFEDGEMKDALIESIANLMKKSYVAWNRDIIGDEVIFDHLKELSQGKLKVKDNVRLASTPEFSQRSSSTSTVKKKKKMNKPGQVGQHKRKF